MKMASDEREKARERLGQAQREQDRLNDRCDAAEGPAGELSAHTELRGARDETTARGRWLEWVESGQSPTPDVAALEELRPR